MGSAALPRLRAVVFRDVFLSALIFAEVSLRCIAMHDPIPIITGSLSSPLLFFVRIKGLTTKPATQSAPA